MLPHIPLDASLLALRGLMLCCSLVGSGIACGSLPQCRLSAGKQGHAAWALSHHLHLATSLPPQQECLSLATHSAALRSYRRALSISGDTAAVSQ